MDEMTQNLKKQFDALPSDVQNAISDVNLSTKLQEIVKNNKLMIDQAGKLETETVLVLFGLEPLENYVNNLIKKVGLSSIQASLVAHDVNEAIFKNIRDTLKTINDGLLKAEKETPEQTSNPTKEDVLAGIENPEGIKSDEKSISLSSLQSNGAKPEIHEVMDKGVEIKINNSPSNLSSKEMLSNTLSSAPVSKQAEPLHLNIPDINKNAVESKPVIMPKIQNGKEEIEIKTDNLPEIAPAVLSPMVSSLISKQTPPFHTNISPVENIVKSKLNDTVIVPKQTIVIEEKTKLPEKPKGVVDSYREPII